MMKRGGTGGKIISCCYCGVQSSFQPGSARSGAGLSALICGTCGAPLSSQKARPLAPGKGACLPGDIALDGVTRKKTKNAKVKQAKVKPVKVKGAKVKKPKKRKGVFQVLLSEVADIVEDIFD